MFQTQQGGVRAYLPDKLFPGEAFSGTVEAPPEGASSAPSGYLLQLADQQVVVKDRTFYWTVPAGGGTIPLLLKDFRGTELGHFDLFVSLAPHPQPSISEKFRVPDAVQSKTPIPVLGPFDGNSASTSFKLSGIPAEVLTEVPGKAMVLCSGDLTGPVSYEVSKSSHKSEAETRVLPVASPEPTMPCGDRPHPQLLPHTHARRRRVLLRRKRTLAGVALRAVAPVRSACCLLYDRCKHDRIHQQHRRRRRRHLASESLPGPRPNRFRTVGGRGRSPGRHGCIPRLPTMEVPHQCSRKGAIRAGI
jgi:hypothetical protein